MEIINIFAEYYKAIREAIATTWWFVCPIALFYLFKILYTKYIWKEYKIKLDNIFLEVKPPRNIERSPKIMEQIFTAIHGVYSTPNEFDKYFKGRIHQPLFSFEICGINGELHFFIRTERRFRNMLESLIYAQYAEAEIEEIEDYTQSVPKNIPNPEWDLWGSDFELTRDDAYPLKTYTRFQEEVTKGMIDPIATYADVVAGLPPGQQAWFQLLIIPIKDNEWQKKVKKTVDKLANREVKKEAMILVRFLSEVVSIISAAFRNIFSPVDLVEEKKKDEQPLMFRLTPIEKDVLTAVEESFNKKAFVTKIRFVLVGPKETFKKDNRAGFLGFVYQFNDPNLNTLKANNDTKTYANYFFTKMRTRWAQKKIFNRYITRDNDGPNHLLNTEELATIWHMPDMSALSPAIARIEAKKSGAPLNLPVE